MAFTAVYPASIGPSKKVISWQSFAAQADEELTILAKLAGSDAYRTVVPRVVRSMGRIAPAIVGPGLIASGVLAASALAAEAPRPEIAFERLGYTDEEVAAVRAGEVVSRPRDSAVKTELRAAVAMILPVPFDEIRRRLEANEIRPLDTDLIGHGALSLPLAQSEWDECTLTVDDSDELEQLLHVEPGDVFNLSTSEVERLQSAISERTDDNGSDLNALSIAYRQILQDRFVSYVENGLDGIAPYDRGGGKASSAAMEMREVVDEALPFLRKEFPRFASALKGYPVVIDGYYNRYAWDKTTVEERPVIILSHTLAEIGEDYILGMIRQYYVGHTYNAAQSLWLAYREGNDTLVFHINSTTTDRISGLFSSLAQSVGKKRIRQTLETHFDKLRVYMKSQDP